MIKKPILLLMRGHPGSGKTTLAKEISKTFGWPLIARDQYKDDLEAAGLPKEEIRQKSYSLMWRQAKEYLSGGIPCICDSSLSKPAVLRSIKRIEKETGTSVAFVHCICNDQDIHRTRLESRKDLNLSSHWIKSWQDFLNYLEEDKSRGKYQVSYPELTVDTAMKVDFGNLFNWIDHNFSACGL